MVIPIHSGTVGRVRKRGNVVQTLVGNLTKMVFFLC